MKQVSSIERHSYIRIVVDVVVAIAPDVGSFLDDEGCLTVEGGVTFGDDGAGESCADYAVVVFFGEGVFVVVVVVVVVVGGVHFGRCTNLCTLLLILL